MNLINKFDYKKATQTLNFFAVQENGKINKMKAIKLVWVADRYHLRKYGRPIINDSYIAMPNGPVASQVKDIAECTDFLNEKEKSYSQEFITRHKRYDIQSKKGVELSVFSQSEIEALNFAYCNYGKFDEFKLVKISHCYPEWKKFEAQLKSSTRESMDYLDFFKDPSNISQDKFKEDSRILDTAKEIFEDNCLLIEEWN